MIEALQWELSLSTVWQERSGTGATMAFFGKTAQKQALLWPFLANPRRNRRHYGVFWGKSVQEQAPLWRFFGKTV